MNQQNAFYTIESEGNRLDITITKSISNKKNWNDFLTYLNKINSKLIEKKVNYEILFHLQKTNITDVKYYKDLSNIFINNDTYLKGIYFICSNKIVIKSIGVFVKLFQTKIPIKFIQSKDDIKQYEV